SELRPTSENEKIQRAQEERDRLQTLLDVAVQEKAQLSNQYERLEKRLQEFEQEFVTAGGVLYEGRDALESEKSNLVNELGLTESRLLNLAAGVAPLLLVPKLLEATEQQ